MNGPVRGITSPDEIVAGQAPSTVSAAPSTVSAVRSRGTRSSVVGHKCGLARFGLTKTQL